MIRIRKIDHVVLRTANPGEMINFYCDVLGCVVERQTEEAIGLTQLRAGECLIDIVSVDGELGQMGGGKPGSSGNNLDHFCLQIEPFEESQLTAHLIEKGLSVGDFENRYGAQGQGPSLYIKDVDGNTVELRAVLGAGSTGSSGGTA